TVSDAPEEIAAVLRERESIVEAGNPAMSLIVIRRSFLRVVIARVLRRKALCVGTQIVDRLGEGIGAEERKAVPSAYLRFNLQRVIGRIAAVLYVGSGSKNRP